jgi:HPt (histidine-containing phosphotransfer) domain-containing protein
LFDVAILDMHMPDMDGVMLAEQIRRYRDAQALPLVLFTSLGRREVNTQGVEFAAFLHKPLKPSHLYNVLSSLFAEQEQAQPLLWRAEVTETRFDAGLGQRLPLRLLLAEDNTLNQKLPMVLAELRQLQGEGEPDIVQELTQAFQFETPPLLEALGQTVVQGQPEQLKRAAHNLGARRLVALSAELEVLGRHESVEGADELVTHLEQEYRRVYQALAAESADAT